MAAKKPPFGYLLLLKFLDQAALDSRIPAGALRVLCSLVAHSSPDYETFVSQAEIAKQRGVSRQAVGAQIKRLQTLGYIFREKRFGADRRQISDLCRFNVSLVQPAERAPATSKNCGIGNQTRLRPPHPREVAQRDHSRNYLRRNGLEGKGEGGCAPPDSAGDRPNPKAAGAAGDKSMPREQLALEQIVKSFDPPIQPRQISPAVWVLAGQLARAGDPQAAEKMLRDALGPTHA